VETFLAQFAAAASRATWLNRISTLFAFAVRREFLAKNPCARLERIRMDRRAPVILSPGQSQLLLKVTPTVLRPYVILGLFAGIRPEELLRMTWADVDLETGTATVNDAKTRRRRIVPLHGKALALLAEHPMKAGAVAPSNSTVRRYKRRACSALGLERWPADLLRHTAASYLLALHGDAGKVATMLGNSSAILLSHYHQPVRNGDCGEFWGLAGKPTL
ncbi:MAG: tyrosine-type recombinase/integrase, partial [Limisphaerales bacterium]